jgi:hypothetical protein
MKILSRDRLFIFCVNGPSRPVYTNNVRSCRATKVRTNLFLDSNFFISLHRVLTVGFYSYLRMWYIFRDY